MIQLQELLMRQLKLKRAQFVLKKDGPYINGSIVSESFKAKGDRERQRAIWDALTAELGDEATKTVGMIIAYTPAEWELDPLPPSRQKPRVRIPNAKRPPRASIAKGGRNGSAKKTRTV